MRAWLSETAGGLPRTFWYLWTGNLINRMGAFVVPFLAIYLAAARGLAESQIGLVLGLYGAGAAAGTMIGGAAADRFGRRPTLLVAHLGAAVMMLNLAFARDLLVITIGAAALGLFAEAARPAFSAMLVDVVEPKDRLRAFTLNYWAINLGFASSAILAGFAAQVDYMLLFLIDAATILVTAVLIFLRVPESRPVAGAVRAGAAAPRTAGMVLLLRDHVFLVYVALNLLIAVVFMQHLSTLPIAMTADGLSPSTYGAVIALNGVLIVVGQLFVPRLIKGRDHSRTMAVAALVVGLGFGLTAVAHVAPVYALTVVIWTLGEMLNAPSNSALMAELSPVELRGRYQGAAALSWAGASAIAPIAGGYLQEHAGHVALWLSTAVVCALAAIGHLLARPSRIRRIAVVAAAEAAVQEPAVR
ncbi:MDR family MFS transporter [Catenuloplanes atrovinosus]|uniref:MFS family permease n=1 Tax=Catenuloplanes atrovinosus TaxID=137266 RepID=A0AAE3YVM2_9ACTN|nr:MFS transporter [Catenuloplanes atrovinosus]MDR7280520.1 MFS family permease [Catenuloplanes atrovinosus]